MKKLTKKIAIEKLNRAIEEIPEIKKLGRKAAEFKKWKRDTEITISYIFGDRSRHLKDFNKINYRLGAFSTRTPEEKFEEVFQRGLDNAKAILSSMVQEVQEYWEESDNEEEELKETKPKNIQTSDLGKDIFIIHGHDDGLKETVARFISQIGLNPIILHEQPNEGRTIIEKFEHNSSATTYAIGLFTPDDVGGSEKEPTELQPRARQNVIFEFGFFIGKLGRNKVAALYKEGVELPSDYSGVIYIPTDESNSWKFLLIKELKSVGFKVDANKAI